jgi:membrane-associated phospholipid phosphatase
VLQSDIAGRTLRVLAVYLALTAIPVMRAGMMGATSSGLVVAALHTTMLAAIIALVVMGRAADLVAWLPLALWPALYAEVPTVIAGLGGSFHDATVQGWERAIFGGQPAFTLAGAIPSRALSELLHLGYLSYYPLIYLPPILLFVRGRRAEFAQTVFALTCVWVACLVAFAVFPVEGPRYQWSPPAELGPIRMLVLVLLESGSARGTAFPSSHVAVAVVQTMAALRYQPRVGAIASVATVLLACGAVYGGFHYAVDVIAGAALGLFVGRMTVSRPASQ